MHSREETFRHENLEVWQLAVRFANTVYQESRTFPPEERYGLGLQLRRAAVSVASNIAEDCARRTKKDFSRSIEIAYGSALEAMTQLVIARDQGFLPSKQYEILREDAARLCRMMSGLRASLVR